MTHPTFQDSSSGLFYCASIALGPLLLLGAGLLPRAAFASNGARAARLGAFVALGALGLAVAAAAGLGLSGPLAVAAWTRGPALYFDALSAVMLLLVAFLGAIVTRFSCQYLAGDPLQARFTRWLCVTLGCVLTLIVSGNLLQFTLAWVGTSLSLHQLLTFYPNRPAALLAARKKFVVSRLGDACLLGALALAWQGFGTWEFEAMFAAAEALRASGEAAPAGLSWMSGLLVAGALLKSAQFPFHSWLPDTMETPTPVSALMHAGIINAGGFLILRLSPLVAAAPRVLDALALVGAFTALFASVIMLTQTSVKRSLAYSTIAQMGFMMLQCGLGAFALALLHIVAHSLYKAHAFLASGSIVSLGKSAWVPGERPAAHPLILLGTFGAAIALSAGMGALFGLRFSSGPGVLLLGSVFMMALSSMLWNLWASSHRTALLGWGLLVGAGAAGSYFALHAVFERLLESALPHYAPERGVIDYAVMGAILLLFMAVLIFQAQLPLWSATPLGRALYVHASQGFYLGTLANRLLLAFKPAA